MEYGGYPGKYPAVVETYDQTTRQVRVSIPGITDGKDVFPLAEIEYPVGDKSRIVEGQHQTEIEILPGDHIWVEFIGGDERYPLITGYRNPNAPSSNSINWRRWHHANIELTADGIMRLNAHDIEFNAIATITTNAKNSTRNIAETDTTTATDTVINAKTQVNGSMLKHNSKNVGDTHTHPHGDPVVGVPT
ncbi:MAG: hypothetical protein M0Q44_01455 [Methylobacter sp.]|jgi:hypothetical protein|nr:hypothetical protein [Methylobacter sp.]